MNKKQITKITKRNECYYCKHKKNIPWNTNIECNKPDTEMKGDIHGVKNGWFVYPHNFDPMWKEKKCKNFKEK